MPETTTATTTTSKKVVTEKTEYRFEIRQIDFSFLSILAVNRRNFVHCFFI